MKPRYMVIRLPESFPGGSDFDLFAAACQYVSMHVAAVSASNPKATPEDKEECKVGMLVVDPDTQNRALYKAMHRELGCEPTPGNDWYERRIECGVGGFND